MEYAVLKGILTDELGGKKVKEVIELDHPRVTFIVDVGSTESLSLTKVTKVRFADKYLEIDSDDGRVFVEPDAVRSVRAEGAEAKESRPGFHG